MKTEENNVEINNSDYSVSATQGANNYCFILYLFLPRQAIGSL